MYRQWRPPSGLEIFLLLFSCLFLILLPFYVTGHLTSLLNGMTQPSHVSSQLQEPAISGDKQVFVDAARSDAHAAGIPPVLFVQQTNQESGFNPSEVSPAGAIGIAQFMPGIAAGLGIDPWNPYQSLQGAAQLMSRYARNYGGDYAKALAAYNGGTGNLQRAMQQCGAAWLSCEPAETQHYIYVIMG